MIVAEKTREIIQDVIPAPVAIPTDAVLLRLGKDVLIDGAPSKRMVGQASEDLAFKFAAQVAGIANGETQGGSSRASPAGAANPGSWTFGAAQCRALVHTAGPDCRQPRKA